MKLPDDTREAHYEVEVRRNINSGEQVVVLKPSGPGLPTWMHMAFTPSQLARLLRDLDQTAGRAWGEDWVADATAAALGIPGSPGAGP